jgi:hypothetical protein
MVMLIFIAVRTTYHTYTILFVTMPVYRKEEKKKTASLFSTDETLQCEQMVSVAEFTIILYTHIY